jgi:hypothetical protein
LERKVEALDALPARVDTLTQEVSSLRVEFSQFRQETRGEFSAIRTEMGGMRA